MGVFGSWYAAGKRALTDNGIGIGVAKSDPIRPDRRTGDCDMQIRVARARACPNRGVLGAHMVQQPQHGASSQRPRALR